MPKLTARDRLFLQLVHSTPWEQLKAIFSAAGVSDELIEEFQKILNE